MLTCSGHLESPKASHLQGHYVRRLSAVPNGMYPVLCACTSQYFSQGLHTVSAQQLEDTLI
jgi:hypothetical protein